MLNIIANIITTTIFKGVDKGGKRKWQIVSL